MWAVDQLPTGTDPGIVFMDLLELNCPTCEQPLVLDAGFAGGVCRCSCCGTLLTVPDAPNPTHRPQPTGSRPDQPGIAVADMAGAQQAAVHSAQASDERTTAAPAPASPPQRSKRSRGGNPEPSVGRPTPRPSEPLPVRVRERLAVRAVVVAVLALTVGLCVLAVSALYHYQTSLTAHRSGHDEIQVEFDYDPNTNPYTLGKPNMLGIHLSPKTVVVVDASAASRRWLGLVKDAILAGSDFQTRAVAIQLFFATEHGQTIYPPTVTELISLQRNEMRNYLNSTLADGVIDPVDAARNAIATQPAQVILVTGQDVSAPHLQAIRTQLQQSKKVRFDAILIDSQVRGMKSLTADYGGRYVSVTSQQLGTWRYTSP